MPFQPALDVAEVRFRFILGGEPCNNIQHYQFLAGAPSLSDVEALTLFMSIWCSSQLMPQLSEQVFFDTVFVRDLTAQFSFESADFGGQAGGIAGDVEPNNVAPCISFRTGLSGRSLRGRNYIVGAPASKVTGNLIDPDWATTLRGVYNQNSLISGSGPPGWMWIVLSRVFNGAPRPTAFGQEIRQVVFTDLVVDSQRDRLPGHRRKKKKTLVGG